MLRKNHKSYKKILTVIISSTPYAWGLCKMSPNSIADASTPTEFLSILLNEFFLRTRKSGSTIAYVSYRGIRTVSFGKYESIAINSRNWEELDFHSVLYDKLRVKRLNFLCMECQRHLSFFKSKIFEYFYITSDFHLSMPSHGKKFYFCSSNWLNFIRILNVQLFVSIFNLHFLSLNPSLRR